MKRYLLLSALLGCTTNHTLAVAPQPQQLGDYLRDRHPADLLVTDSLGRQLWLHSPELVGDSVAGLSSRELPHRRRAIPLGEVRGFAEPHFSAGRTAELVGGALGLAGAALIIYSMERDEEIYASLGSARPE